MSEDFARNYLARYFVATAAVPGTKLPRAVQTVYRALCKMERSTGANERSARQDAAKRIRAVLADCRLHERSRNLVIERLNAIKG